MNNTDANKKTSASSAAPGSAGPKERRSRLHRGELIVILLVLALALIAAFLLQKKKETGNYGSIRITVSGEDYGTYSLDEDQVVKINDHNTCRIQNHMVRMIEATCPDHICITQPPIDEKGGFIICLPNQVIIEGIPAEGAGTGADDGLDGIAG